MGATIYSLLGILWWNLIGQYMYYVYARLSLSATWVERLLPRFDPGPPQWWLDTWHVYSWWNDNLDDRVPNTAFVLLYRRAAKDRYQDWVEDAADRVARPLVNAVSNLLGSLLYGYTTFSTWINALRGRVGAYVPYWADHLAHAAMRLFDWLPSDITAGVVSFYDKFVAWYEATKAWVQTNYDAAKTWAFNAYNWVIDTGQQLNNWWLGIRDFLDGFFHYHVSWVKRWLGAAWTWVENFRDDPYGTVAGWLGAAWAFLHGAYVGLYNFYNYVWVPYKVTLHNFLADPLLWLYDRVEDELIRQW